MEEIYESQTRTGGDLAGVFEFDGEVSYFYLYAVKDNGSLKIGAAIKILTGPPDFRAADISIRWDPSEEFVGLFIEGRFRAAFDERGRGYGPVPADAANEIPPELRGRFRLQ
jgi:hypothetical protein